MKIQQIQIIITKNPQSKYDGSINSPSQHKNKFSPNNYRIHKNLIKNAFHSLFYCITLALQHESEPIVNAWSRGCTNKSI